MFVSDPQDQAESFDEDAIGSSDPLLSDEVEVDYPPDKPHGVPFADSDVTDESFAEREEQQEPEVGEPSESGDTRSSVDPSEDAEPE
jgi:hypothetical protein